MPKILAYAALHYGVEYLQAAIEAIYPFVDKIIFLYSKNPSYGYGTHIQCPDGEEQLKVISDQYDKCQWVRVNPCHEGNHRAQVFEYSQGYDGILVFDADEVYEPSDLQALIQYCHNSDKARFGIDGYINFWKSFNHACYDGFRPIRYHNLNNKDGEDLNAKCRIYHFGCAQRMDIMRYKLLVHGHKQELRPNWLSDVYEAWNPVQNQQNLHLVAHNLWNAVEFDKSTLPDILKRHSNYNKEVI